MSTWLIINEKDITDRRITAEKLFVNPSGYLIFSNKVGRAFEIQVVLPPSQWVEVRLEPAD